MKRLFFIIAAIAITSTSAQAKYSGGSGTADDPYKIATASDLLELAAATDDYDANFVVTSDIDLATYVFATAVIAQDTNNSNWDFDGDEFTGDFNGNNHTINNLTINTGGAGNDFLGLFGDIGYGGEVKNIRLENLSITGGNESIYLGGLAGFNNGGTISNCFSTGAVACGVGSYFIGGLVGYTTVSSSISNCYSTSDVNGGNNSQYLGGLAGYDNYGDISNCHSTGAVAGGNSSGRLGGLVGNNDGGNISNCYSTGTVTGTYNLGGLVGCHQIEGSISNCYSTGAVTGGAGSSNIGGLAGENEGSISNCHSTGAVAGGVGSPNLGGLVGYNNSGDINNCYSTGTIGGGDNSSNLGGLVGDNYESDINNCFSTGAVVGGAGSSNLGGLVGNNIYGNISNCHSAGNVGGGNASVCLGGLVGWNYGLDYNATISNCYSTGAVTGGNNSYSLGGLVGRNYGSISNCYSTGAVKGGANSEYLGGLVGENSGGGSINDCYSTGNVTGTSSSLGGLVGVNDTGSISDSYFLIGSGPDNGPEEPLTDAQMKQQASFVGWDFVGETINGPNDVWWINKGVDYPKLSWQIKVDKFGIAAGYKETSDKIFISGQFFKPGDINKADEIKVAIDSEDMVKLCVLTFPVNSKTFKKGKFKCTITEKPMKASFAFDTKKTKFSFSARNVSLKGLYCPLNMRIQIGDYTCAAEVNEAKVNGKKPIPISLMMGVKNTLRVDRIQVKQGKKKPNSDQLTVTGDFAMGNTSVDIASSDLNITLNGEPYTIEAGKLKAKKNGFGCSNVVLGDGFSIGSADFNFKTCRFKATIKKTEIEDLHGIVDFGIMIGGEYEENVDVELP